MEILYFLRIHIAISHPYPDSIQSLLLRIHIGITFCLCKMNRRRFFQFFKIMVSSFYLIYRRRIPLLGILPRILDNAIRPSFYDYRILPGFVPVL